jgi:hypothetical protein
MSTTFFLHMSTTFFLPMPTPFFLRDTRMVRVPRHTVESRKSILRTLEEEEEEEEEEEGSRRR